MQYEEVASRTPNYTHLSSAGQGYALLGPPEQPLTDLPPVLSSHEITAGYSLVGSPAQPGAVTNGRCPLRPDSTYSEVRKEGEDFVPPRMGPPSQTAFDDYSRLGFPASAEESEPMPMTGTMVDVTGYVQLYGSVIGI